MKLFNLIKSTLHSIFKFVSLNYINVLMLYITSFQFADQVFSRGVALFERVQFTKDACNAASCHVIRSRTRFSREFRARGGDQGTLGSAIAESITRIAINTVLSLSLSLRYRCRRTCQNHASFQRAHNGAN